MRRNQYEEALFRCEDDRFEVDVILETTRSAIAQLHLLNRELEAVRETQKGTYRLRSDALSSIQLAAIRRVYAHNGMDQEVVKLLFLNPRDCIPRILARLEAKEKEWMGEKVLMNEVRWRGRVRTVAMPRDPEAELLLVAGPSQLLLPADGQEGDHDEGAHRHHQGPRQQAGRRPAS